MTDRSEERPEIMDTTEEDTADQHPQGNRQPAKHSGSDRSGDRACASDGGEMMPHQHRCLCRHIVDAIIHGMRRCRDIPLTYAPLLDQPAPIKYITAKQNH